MRFLLDMPLSQRTAAWLRAQGHEVIHARDVGLSQSNDADILNRARQDKRIVVTIDLDFPHLLSIMSLEDPGLILFRLRRPSQEVIQKQLTSLFKVVSEADLIRSIAVLEDSRIRLHRLPIH
jgi:predicted nuclease of predicted toxin-antitoxin system